METPTHLVQVLRGEVERLTQISRSRHQTPGAVPVPAPCGRYAMW